MLLKVDDMCKQQVDNQFTTDHNKPVYNKLFVGLNILINLPTVVEYNKQSQQI